MTSARVKSAGVPRVLIIDDISAAREWAWLLQDEFEVRSAQTLDGALAAMAPDEWKARPFHAVVSELDLPDGYGCDVVQTARTLLPRPGIAVVSRALTSERLIYLQSLGVRVATKPIPSSSARLLMEMLVCSVDPRLDRFIDEATLSPREAQLVRLYAAGHREDQIALLMSCSTSTLKTFWRRIRHKTGATSRREVLTKALSRRDT